MITYTQLHVFIKNIRKTLLLICNQRFMYYVESWSRWIVCVQYFADMMVSVFHGKHRFVALKQQIGQVKAKIRQHLSDYTADTVSEL